MLDPFVGRRTLTPEQWKARGEAIQARLQGLSIDELMRGSHGAEAPHVGAHGQRRGGYDPNQPRVPAGHSDGGQWTDDDRWASHPLVGARFAASRELPPIGPLRIARILQRALKIIETLRTDNLLYDLFGRPRGTVSMLEIEGRTFFGSNSRLWPLYKSQDRVEAEQLRTVLVRKYPDLVRNNEGQAPLDAVYHAETNVLLRAAREFGGTLAGRRLEVVTDKRMCPSCPDILPKLGLEIGNPTVTFIGPRGQVRTMQDGKWLD
jgi:hypothetical protein